MLKEPRLEYCPIWPLSKCKMQLSINLFSCQCFLKDTQLLAFVASTDIEVFIKRS